MNIIKCGVSAEKSHICIVISRFNYSINVNLLEGAIETLERVGQVSKKNITTIWIPGAYELPLTVKMACKTKKYDAIITLATIIKGKTQHFEYVKDACNIGLNNVITKSNIPISCGIIIANNTKQAINRSGGKSGNKGSDAALVTLEMINVLRQIKKT